MNGLDPDEPKQNQYPASPGMLGRLNSIQKSMLQWNELHPYSAIHVVQIHGILDRARLQTSVNLILARRGLTGLTLDGKRYAFQYNGGPAHVEIQIITGEQEPWGALLAEMEKQLNARWTVAPSFSPFRFLAAPGGDCFYLGLVYFHPVADAESVVWLLKSIVTEYREEVSGDSQGVLQRYPDSHAHLLGRHAGVLLRKLLALPAQVRQLRHSHRPGYRDANNLANGIFCFSVVASELRGLVAGARSWGVTVNDVFLALLLTSLSPYAASRRREQKRRQMSVGCIVNLRQDLGVDGERVFGVFLGSFVVTHEVSLGIGLRQLAQDIHEQTAHIKRHRLYLATPLELDFGRLMLRLFSPGRRKKFYAKHYPLWGGITNLNLNRLWGPAVRHGPLDYFRVVSTGPITPLVLSVTTVGERVNLGVSYRTAVFSKSDIESLESRFLEHLEETQQSL